MEKARRKFPPPYAYLPTLRTVSRFWQKKGEVRIVQKNNKIGVPFVQKKLDTFLYFSYMIIMGFEENSWSGNWSDRTLLDYLLFTTKFTQEELAKRLGFNRVQISKVLHGKSKLRPAVRYLALELCKKLDEGQPV